MFTFGFFSVTQHYKATKWFQIAIKPQIKLIIFIKYDFIIGQSFYIVNFPMDQNLM